MRKKIVAGNWKMNKTFSEAEELITEIADQLDGTKPENVEVILCPPYIYLELATDIAEDAPYSVGAQNINDHDMGAYTGEISAQMLIELNVAYAIIGHSERRKYYNESHEFLAGKVDSALRHGIRPIFCCGETLPEREAEKYKEIVKTQLYDSLFHLTPEQFGWVIIAYEPVWAIGTGVNATPAQAQEMHAYIRKLIADKYDPQIAGETTILYGGSCNSKNARELFAQADVDGGLIGGASLIADEFISIIKSF
ncbi:MAG: triose-phosphate isomerase [Bacteroidetes bacterium]|nr:triose-phosphate isomerase [Bacteroidota bacterium]